VDLGITCYLPRLAWDPLGFFPLHLGSGMHSVSPYLRSPDDTLVQHKTCRFFLSDFRSFLTVSGVWKKFVDVFLTTWKCQFHG
jgi:hypothetical protein